MAGEHAPANIGDTAAILVIISARLYAKDRFHSNVYHHVATFFDPKNVF